MSIHLITQAKAYDNEINEQSQYVDDVKKWKLQRYELSALAFVFGREQLTEKLLALKIVSYHYEKNFGEKKHKWCLIASLICCTDC